VPPFANGKLVPDRRLSRSSPAGFELKISTHEFFIEFSITFAYPSYLLLLSLGKVGSIFYPKTLSRFLTLLSWLPMQNAACQSARGNKKRLRK
jgi:hypothetical protein